MILDNGYLPAIQELKKGNKVAVMNNARAQNMALNICAAGRAVLDSIELSFGSMDILKPITKPKPAIHIAPKQAPYAKDSLILVSRWRTGKRAGKFAQCKHVVVDCPKDGYVTYEDTTGHNHTIAIQFTKAVA